MNQQHVHTIFQTITQQLKRGQLALFIGADLPSEVTGLPSRADLARELARRHDLSVSHSLAETAQRVARGGNRWAFTAFLRDALDTAGKSPQPFHRRVVDVVHEHGVRTLITTAYDNLLELAFQEAGVAVNRLVRGDDVGFIDPDRPTLIKLYGDLQQPDTLVVTADDHYGLGRDRDKEDLLDEVRAVLRKETVLFLGYNLADADFNLLWREVLDRAGRFARTAYAVWPGLLEEDARVWRERGIVIVDADPLGVLDGTEARPASAERPAPPIHAVPSPSPGAGGSGPSREDSRENRNGNENEGLRRALDMARRTLAILEQQAAGFGDLHMPAHLRIELEEKRRQVAELEGRLGLAPAAERPVAPTPEPSAAPGPAPDDCFDLQVRVRAFDSAGQAYPVEARLGDGSHFEDGTLRPDWDALRNAELDSRAYGVALFEALFRGNILRAYDRATTFAEVQTDGRLRLRLWIDADAAELHALAWERLHHRVQGAPLPVAASAETPFSRYAGLERSEPAPVAERPMRLLFAISNPTDLADYGLDPLNVGQEVESLLGALGDLRGAGQVRVALMPGRTGLPGPLRERLEREGCRVLEGPTAVERLVRAVSRDGGYHVLHFLGHGAFDRQRQRAALFLERERGGVERVVDERLAALLKSAGPLPHLVFMAACESARRDPERGNPFVGLAPRLVQVGVPAVVAMQDVVSVVAARRFARDFYARLLEHGVVDRAANQARLSLYNAGYNAAATDWAVPVLFMRLEEGRLFRASS